MGHYYTEMCCPECGQIRCMCPEVIERRAKYARMSFEEKMNLKMETLLAAMELAEKMDKREKK